MGGSVSHVLFGGTQKDRHIQIHGRDGDNSKYFIFQTVIFQSKAGLLVVIGTGKAGLSLGIDRFIVGGHICPQFWIKLFFGWLGGDDDNGTVVSGGGLDLYPAVKVLGILVYLPVNQGSLSIGIEKETQSSQKHQNHDANNALTDHIISSECTKPHLQGLR